MTHCNLEGYTIHAKQMSRRVRDRKSHPELSAIDRIVEAKLQERQPLTILDIGCGTGERLKMILERSDIDLNKAKITGVDFCLPLLEEAKDKELNGRKIYCDLIHTDAKDIPNEKQFDIILCLFSVLNNVGDLMAVNTWAPLLRKDGLLILDVLHPGVIPHFFKDKEPILEKRFGKTEQNVFYYRRKTDNSFGQATIWSFDILADTLQANNLAIKEAYDILTFRSKGRKGALARPYKDNTPGTTHEKAWPNSILFICTKP